MGKISTRILAATMLICTGCTGQNSEPLEKSVTSANVQTIFSTKGKVYPSAWSGEGNHLYASLHLNDQWNVIKINKENSDAQTIDLGMGAGVGDVWGNDLLLESPTNGQSEIFLFSGVTRTVTQITKSDASEYHPVFGVDPGQIIYDSNEKGSRDIYSYNIESGKAERLTSSPQTEQGGRLSPDGLQLAFHRHSGSGEVYDIVVLGLASGQERELTQGTNDNSYPRWISGGREILFSSNRTGNFELYTVCVSGGIPKPLTSSGNDAKYPVISRDGETVAFQVNTDDKSEIKTIALTENPLCPQ